MSQAESSASHWVLLFFLGLLNKYMLVWSIEYASIDLSSSRQDSMHRTWSEWTLWSACSRTCGGGIKMRTRVCNMRMHTRSSAPNACVGETVEYEICSVHNCSPFDKEFLEYQCSLRDGQPVGGRSIEEWIPYRYGKNPCELQCWSKDRTLVRSFGKAIDGTKCATTDPRQPALCINGRCTPVDCAGQIGQDNRPDRCGVCRGDNSTCVHFQDVFWGQPRAKTSIDGSRGNHYDYEKIAVIPAGATKIVVKESSENNFLALMDHKGHYQVNGNWRIQSPGRFVVHGSDFNYNRTWDGGESLSTSGPTRFDVFVHVLGTGDIPTVQYEYWISENNPFKPVRTLQTLDPVRPSDRHESESKSSQPENNHIHDASAFTKKSAIPHSKFQGYKSYYHRNEILKSVPSWSVKRHRAHKNNLNRHFPPRTDVHGTDYVNQNTRFVPLDNQQVQARSDTVDKVNAKDELDKTNYEHSTSPRTYNPTNVRTIPTSVPRIVATAKASDLQVNGIPSSNKERYVNPRAETASNVRTIPTSIPRNVVAIAKAGDFQIQSGNHERYLNHRTETAANAGAIPARRKSNTTISGTEGSHRNEIRVPSGIHKRYDPKQVNGIETPRKRLFENIEQSVDGYGRPTTTLAQTRKVHSHQKSFVTSRPTYFEKDGNFTPNSGRRENRRRESNEKPNHDKKRRKSENGVCQPCPKPKHQKKNFCSSDFVLRATVLSSEKQEDSFRHELEISRSYKNKVPISPREYVWTTDSCRCPKLRTGKEYIIMGNSGTGGNRRESRLLVTRNSFYRKYSQKKARNMLRLVRDQKTICKNLE